MYHCIDFSPKPNGDDLLLSSFHFRDEDREVTCPKSHGQEVARATLETQWSTPYLEFCSAAGSGSTPTPHTPLLQRMRPAPASSPSLWVAEEGGALGQRRAELKWFPGILGCGGFLLWQRYLPKPLQVFLWLPPTGPLHHPPNCLLPLLGSAPSSHKWGGGCKA